MKLMQGQQTAQPTVLGALVNKESQIPQSIAPTSGRNKKQELPDLGSHFEVLELMERRQSSLIYKAKDSRYDNYVAVEYFPSSAGNECAERLIRRDLDAISRLNHPNLVSIYECGKASDGALYVVREFFQGESLASIVSREGSLSPERVMNIFVQVCDALAHAHRAGVLHRGLQPNKILISTSYDGTDSVKLIDFRTANVASTGEGNANTDVCYVDSPYMSPEQRRGDVKDKRVDIYSLGCIMYEALTGSLPIKDDPFDCGESLIQPGRTGVAARLNGCILRCLEEQPADRYKDADAVLYQLTSTIVSEQAKANGGDQPRWLMSAVVGIFFALMLAAAIYALAPGQLWLAALAVPLAIAIPIAYSELRYQRRALFLRD